MRILHISSMWPPHIIGGAEAYASTLAVAQRKAGHTVGVVTFGVDAEDAVAVVPAWPYRLDQVTRRPRWKAAALRLEDIYNPLAARQMRQAIDRFDPDVVHSHSVTGLSTAAVTVTGKRAAHVHHLHDYWLICRRATTRLPSGEPCNDPSCRAVAALRDLVVRRRPPDLLFSGSRACLAAHAGYPWALDRLRHVPYTIGVNLEGRSDPPADGSPLTFGFIGQLTPQKGIGTLLDAFRDLSGGHRLVVAGEGPLSPEVANAGSNVEMLGWIAGADKARFLSDVDCLVVPSNWPETGPLVVLEARANGLPVIGSRIGGTAETVGTRCEPLLFTAGDSDDLRRSIERFAADPERFRLASDAAPQLFSRTWPEHVADVDALYDEAIGRAATRRG
jgi:glycosyltransferase involved in cell wall biosynthesis